MTDSNRNDNGLIILFNAAGVVIAYGMLALSLYMSPDVPFAFINERLLGHRHPPAHP
jgi:hypothetical protein